MLSNAACSAVNVTAYTPIDEVVVPHRFKSVGAMRGDVCRIKPDDTSAFVEVMVPDVWSRMKISKLTGSVAAMGRDVMAPISRVRRDAEIRVRSSISAYIFPTSTVLPAESLVVTANGKKLKRELVIFIMQQACSLTCFSQGINHRAPIHGFAGAVVLPKDGI